MRPLILTALMFISISQVSCTPVPQAVESQPVVQEASSTPTLIPEPSPTIATATPSESQANDEEITVMPTANPDLEYAQVIFVKATQGSNGLWKFDTTVRHNDQGWDNYADAWQVVDLDGNLLAERILLHPHDGEQPFTRSETNIDIPSEVTQVMVRAKDNVEGFGGQVVVVDLTVSAGENFEVVRNEP